MNSVSKVVMGNANNLLAASKSLDYSLIANHQIEEVKKLHAVLVEFDIKKYRREESLSSYASQQQGPRASMEELDDLPPAEMGGDNYETGIKEEAVTEPIAKEEIESNLQEEGMGDRVGLVYNSLSKDSDRTLQFKQAHHRRGVPSFDIVVAPDCSPVSGLHGIFINGHEVMSIVLPADDPSGDWQIMKRKAYTNADEMMEYLSLLSAGFDLP